MLFGAAHVRHPPCKVLLEKVQRMVRGSAPADGSPQQYCTYTADAESPWTLETKCKRSRPLLQHKAAGHMWQATNNQWGCRLMLRPSQRTSEM